MLVSVVGSINSVYQVEKTHLSDGTIQATYSDGTIRVCDPRKMSMKTTDPSGKIIENDFKTGVMKTTDLSGKIIESRRNYMRITLPDRTVQECIQQSKIKYVIITFPDPNPIKVVKAVLPTGQMKITYRDGKEEFFP